MSEHDAYVAYMAVFPGQVNAWVAMCPCGWRSPRGNETTAWAHRDEHRADAGPEPGTVEE